MSNYPLARPHIDQKDIDAVVAVLKSGALSMGARYLEFENKITGYTKSRFACAVANGTCGLHLAVKALGLKEGDEVITSPFSFISSSNCLIYEKVKPVFIDIEEQTYNLDPNKIEKAITKKTKAILVVHIFGQTANMDPIIKIAKKYKLKIIEDACESLGAKYKNKMAGSFGDVGVYAFYPNKQMTTGEGGMIVSNSLKIINLCKSLRNQGRNLKNDWLTHEKLGYNYRMDEMSAALGVSQLMKLDWFIEKRNKLVGWYNEILDNDPRIVIPKTASKRTNSWFVYVIRILNGKRNSIIRLLADRGIQTKPYLPVIHLQPFMKCMFGFKKGDFPISEKIASQTLALPFYVGLTHKDIKQICTVLQTQL